MNQLVINKFVFKILVPSLIETIFTFLLVHYIHSETSLNTMSSVI